MHHNTWGRAPVLRLRGPGVGALILWGALLPAYPSVEEPAAGALNDIPELELFIDEMAEKHGFERVELEAIFNRARLRTSILRAISEPAERRPWHRYRNIFINDARIRDGASFMLRNAETLMMARRAYGVPEELTTAILGVETGYGKRTGSHRVLDALVTLAFQYPRRADLFRRELEHYLLLTREEGFRPWNMKGSYAGAMGIAQFMPTSYRQYAVDFDGDGKRDLRRNVADAIGSVAHYFKMHGWQPLGPVAVKAALKEGASSPLLKEGSHARRRIDEWIKIGLEPEETFPGHWTAFLIVLDAGDGPECWLGFHNFEVITLYNRSTNYAMAVYQLSREIEALRRRIVFSSE